MKRSVQAKTVGLLVLVMMIVPAVSSCQLLKDPPRPTMGGSVKMALDNQKLNPEPTPPVPVEGMDGEYAEKSVAAYRAHEAGAGKKSSKTGLLPVLLNEGK